MQQNNKTLFSTTVCYDCENDGFARVIAFQLSTQFSTNNNKDYAKQIVISTILILLFPSMFTLFIC